MVVLPLVRRDLLRECRHGAHFITRALFVSALGGLVAWRWLVTVSQTALWGRWRGWSASQTAPALMANLGTMLFGLWAVVGYVAACAFSLVRATSIAEERRTGSLPLLQLTALADGGAVLASFASILGRALFTMVLALPVLIMSASFGGFTVEQVAVVSAVTLAAAAHLTAFALAVAARSTGAAAAVFVAVLLQAAWLTATLLAFPSVGWLNALAFVMGVVRSTTFSVTEFAGILASRLALTALYLLAAAVMLGRPAARPGRRIKRALLAADHFFLRVARNRAVLWRAGLGRCRGNPVLWRERAVSLIGQRDHVIRLSYVAFALVAVVLIAAAPFVGWETFAAIAMIGVVGVPLGAFVLFLVVGPATTFARERQQRTLPLLAVTPLSAARIVAGKLRFCLRMLWIPLALVAVYVACVVAAGFEVEGEVIGVMTVGLAGVLMLAAQIMYVGAGTRSAVQAIAAGAVLVAGAVLFVAPDLRVEVLYLVDVRGAGKVAGLALLPAIAGALAVAILGRRVRFMANAGTLLLLVAGPVVGATFIVRLWPAYGAATDGRMSPLIVRYAPVVIAGGLVLAVWTVGARMSNRGFALALAAAVAAVILLLDIGLERTIFAVAGLAATWRCIRQAGQSVLNRAVLALVAPWQASVVVDWWSGGAFWRWDRAASWGDAEGVLLVWLLPMVVAAAAFYVATVRGLDRLMERNG